MQCITTELKVISDLRPVIDSADIVSTATSAREAIIEGDWVQPGTHFDLIGSYTPDMHEADDRLMAKGRIFVDYRDTTIQCVGDLTQSIANGTITAADIRGDLYELVNGSVQGRKTASDITIFKNGGGAHLDLMIDDYVASIVS